MFIGLRLRFIELVVYCFYRVEVLGKFGRKVVLFSTVIYKVVGYWVNS